MTPTKEKEHGLSHEIGQIKRQTKKKKKKKTKTREEKPIGDAFQGRGWYKTSNKPTA